MPQAVLEIVASASQFDRLPFSIDQKSSRSSALILLALLVPALCVVFLPVAFLAAAMPGLDIVAEQPVAALQVMTGLCICTGLFVVPAKRLVQRFGSRRSVRITEGAVTVSDAGLFGSRVWTAPLSEFSGIAHHVRATLSGLRHELVLVHPTRNRSILIHAGDHMTRAALERATSLLRLPEVPARELYRRARPQPQVGPAIGIPQAQAA